MKNFLIIFLFLGALLSGNTMRAQSKSKWSVGLRTGAVKEFTSLKEKRTISDKFRSNQQAWSNQVFINRTFGKKDRISLELSAGYHAYTHEEMEGFYYNVTGADVFYYNFFKRNVYTFQLTGRYLLLDMKALKWKHYAGLALGTSDHVESGYGFTETQQLNSGKHTYETYHYWRTFLGVQYFGGITISRKLSVQYALDYAMLNNSFSDLKIAGTPGFSHKLNFNAGLGWHF